MPTNYLIDNPEREHEILSRFDQFLDNFSPFLQSLGIQPLYAWYLIEFQMNDLIPGMRGDVDILAGNLEPASDALYEESWHKIKKLTPESDAFLLHRLAAVDLAAAGNLKWIPSLDYLVGIEVKCCYLPRNAPQKITQDDMKSKKSSPSAKKGVREQINKLLKMGFNKVGLFDFIVNPPAAGIGNVPWNIASYRSGQSTDAMERILEERLPIDSPAGHGASSFTGILGLEEHHAGAYDYPIFRVALNNPLLASEEVNNRRSILEENLALMLQHLTHPHNLPAVYVRDRKTGIVSFINEGIFRG